jgi:hypothetical protein
MTLAEAALLWIGTFASVFLLGVQSRNVHAGAYWPAAITSAGIGVAQLVFVRGAVAGEPWAVLLLTCTAGPAGICFSIWFWQRAAHHFTGRPTT